MANMQWGYAVNQTWISQSTVNDTTSKSLPLLEQCMNGNKDNGKNPELYNKIHITQIS